MAVLLVSMITTLESRKPRLLMAQCNGNHGWVTDLLRVRV